MIESFWCVQQQLLRYCMFEMTLSTHGQASIEIANNYLLKCIATQFNDIHRLSYVTLFRLHNHRRDRHCKFIREMISSHAIFIE